MIMVSVAKSTVIVGRVRVTGVRTDSVRIQGWLKVTILLMDAGTVGTGGVTGRGRGVALLDLISASSDPYKDINFCEVL